jgi:hypothetical protein
MNGIFSFLDEKRFYNGTNIEEGALSKITGI